MDKQILQHAEDKKYTKFSDAVKQELKTKLANNPVIKDYTTEYDRIQQMKDIFSKISTDFGEKPKEISDEE